MFHLLQMSFKNAFTLVFQKELANDVALVDSLTHRSEHQLLITKPLVVREIWQVPLNKLIRIF